MLRRIIAASALLALPGCATRPVVPVALAAPVEVQIIGINDFHGNLETPRGPQKIRLANGQDLNANLGGAAALEATVKRLREGHANTITVSAGDLIGASPLVSAYFLDEPTIAAMNTIGLNLNAVGNHEFDKGSAELLRMQKGGCEKHATREPCAVERFDGAKFGFLAANVVKRDGSTLFPGRAGARSIPRACPAGWSRSAARASTSSPPMSCRRTARRSFRAPRFASSDG